MAPLTQKLSAPSCAVCWGRGCDLGDVLIMDNLWPHKSQPTLKLIGEAGASVLFLPPYSPDLNPIEKMWSKLKECLRSAEARTEQQLLEAIGSALTQVTARDAINWFASCGYSFI
jgi:transposase